MNTNSEVLRKNIVEIKRTSDFSVQVQFTSCRLASEFELSLAALSASESTEQPEQQRVAGFLACHEGRELFSRSVSHLIDHGWPVECITKLYAAPTSTKEPAHTDHHPRHWDRECPACLLSDTAPIADQKEQANPLALSSIAPGGEDVRATVRNEALEESIQALEACAKSQHVTSGSFYLMSLDAIRALKSAAAPIGEASKTAINIKAQNRYDELMQIGKRGHYETMFQVIHEAISDHAREPKTGAASKMYFAGTELVNALYWIDKADGLPAGIDGGMLDRMGKALAEFEDSAASKAMAAEPTILQRALDALEYHQEQTRPIENTMLAIAAIRAAISVQLQKPKDIVHLAGGEVEQPPIAPNGSWLWCKLMDWCKKRHVAPADFNDLFAIAGEAHKLNAASGSPKRERE
jgi:hypothetical protein